MDSRKGSILIDFLKNLQTKENCERMIGDLFENAIIRKSKIILIYLILNCGDMLSSKIINTTNHVQIL